MQTIFYTILIESWYWHPPALCGRETRTLPISWASRPLSPSPPALGPPRPRPWPFTVALWDSHLLIYFSYQVESYTEAPRIECRSRRKNNKSLPQILRLGTMPEPSDFGFEFGTITITIIVTSSITITSIGITITITMLIITISITDKPRLVFLTALWTRDAVPPSSPLLWRRCWFQPTWHNITHIW